LVVVGKLSSSSSHRGWDAGGHDEFVLLAS
jgi:hypothetical protein